MLYWNLKVTNIVKQLFFKMDKYNETEIVFDNINSSNKTEVKKINKLNLKWALQANPVLMDCAGQIKTDWRVKIRISSTEKDWIKQINMTYSTNYATANVSRSGDSSRTFKFLGFWHIVGTTTAEEFNLNSLQSKTIKYWEL